MTRLISALKLWALYPIRWSTAWRLARPAGRYRIVARGGFLYVERDVLWPRR